MSYQRDRDQFVARMTQEGMPFHYMMALLRAATTIQRYAELACSSEAADRDRVPCPADTKDLRGKPRKPTGECCCDINGGDEHRDVPRITVQEARLVARLEKAIPDGWTLRTAGDPRGYTLAVIPPSYAERNQGRDHFNQDTIGVPSGPTRLRF